MLHPRPTVRLAGFANNCSHVIKVFVNIYSIYIKCTIKKAARHAIPYRQYRSLSAVYGPPRPATPVRALSDNECVMRTRPSRCTRVLCGSQCMHACMVVLVVNACVCGSRIAWMHMWQSHVCCVAVCGSQCMGAWPCVSGSQCVREWQSMRA